MVRLTDRQMDGWTEKLIWCGLSNHTRKAWAGGTFLHFLRIFLLNPNFLLAHRNRYSEGTDNGQKNPTDTLI
jgi:hypothetical protein